MTLSMQQQQDLEGYITDLQSENPQIVETARNGIQLLGEDAVDYLRIRLLNAHHPDTIRATIEAITLIPSDEVTLALSDALQIDNLDVAEAAWQALGDLGRLPEDWEADVFPTDIWQSQHENDESEGVVIPVNKSKKRPPAPRLTNARAGDYLIRTRLLPLLHGDDAAKRAEAMDEFMRLGEKAVPVLIESLENDDRSTWKQTILLLKKIGDKRALDVLIMRSDDEDKLIQTLAGGAARAIERGVTATPKPALGNIQHTAVPTSMSDPIPNQTPTDRPAFKARYTADLTKREQPYTRGHNN